MGKEKGVLFSASRLGSLYGQNPSYLGGENLSIYQGFILQFFFVIAIK